MIGFLFSESTLMAFIADIAFVFFILEMVQFYHWKPMDISEWIATEASIRCEEM
jgi:hypothetical protein